MLSAIADCATPDELAAMQANDVTFQKIELVMNPATRCGFVLGTLESIEVHEGMFDLYLKHMMAVELAAKKRIALERIEAAAPLIDFEHDPEIAEAAAKEKVAVYAELL
jgi:hypothetical protein